MICHSFGLTSDSTNHLENLTRPENSKSSTFKHPELRDITDDNCFDYMENNLWSGKENTEDKKNSIVIPHLEQLDPKSINFKISKIFREKQLLPKQNSFLFTSCNLYKYLQMTNHTEAEINAMYGDTLKKDLSNVMIIYPADINAVILITLPENEKETLHSLHLKANSTANAYQSLHPHQMLGDEKFCIVNVVGAVYHEKPKQQQQRYCTKCEPLSTIFLDDVENLEESWWKPLKDFIKEKIDTRLGAADLERDFKRRMASRLVVINALTDDKFPKLFGSVDNQIKKMCLNEIQRDILLSSTLKKIIIGEDFDNLKPQPFFKHDFGLLTRFELHNEPHFNVAQNDYYCYYYYFLLSLFRSLWCWKEYNYSTRDSTIPGKRWLCALLHWFR